MEPDALISREELSATLFSIADIRNDVSTIRKLLEDDEDEEEEES